MVVETHLVFPAFNTFLGDRLSAGPRLIEFLDEIQNHMHRTDMRVGAIVCAPFLVDGTSAEDTREILVGDTDRRVGLAVFQQDIVSGIVLLDECVLQ